MENFPLLTRIYLQMALNNFSLNCLVIYKPQKILASKLILIHV